MKSELLEPEKPLVVLVHEPSILRLWMERTLRKNYNVCVFSGSEEALAFIRSIACFDVLVTDLCLGKSAAGGCNVAREVDQRFKSVCIFVLVDGESDDHRLIFLHQMKRVRLLSRPWGCIFIVRHLNNALKRKLTGSSDEVIS